jgi:hypothetical protein
MGRFDNPDSISGSKTVNNYFYRFIERPFCKRFHAKIFTIYFWGFRPEKSFSLGFLDKKISRNFTDF